MSSTRCPVINEKVLEQQHKQPLRYTRALSLFATRIVKSTHFMTLYGILKNLTTPNTNKMPSVNLKDREPYGRIPMRLIRQATQTTKAPSHISKRSLTIRYTTEQ